MGLKLITAPASSPVSLAEAKAQLRVTTADDDAQISLFIKAATAAAERFCGRAFVEQVWDYTIDAFPAGGAAIELPLPPLIELIGLFTSDAAGLEAELDAGSYRVDAASEPARVMPAGGSWPSSGGARLRLRAGYLDQSSPPLEAVPFDVKASILIMVGTLYNNRESIVIGATAVQLPWTAEHLLRLHRMHTAIG
jgi:uncharacterized phiE125 gp8 family phage protein